MSKVLYHQKVVKYDMNFDEYSQMVEVEVRRHFPSNAKDEYGDCKYGDVVIHSIVIVDSEEVIDQRDARSPVSPNYKHIREGISIFDELLKNHPNKDELQ